MDKQPTRVLIIEGDADETSIIGSYLTHDADRGETFELTWAPRISTALSLLGRQSFDVVLLDLVLPMSVGLEGFRKIRDMRPGLPILVLTGLQDVPLAAQAVQLGAYDYFVKGSPDCCMIKRAIRYALERKRLAEALGEPPLAPRESEPSERLKRLQAEIKEGLRVVEVKNHFLNQITHELRNALAALTTAAYCLKDGVAGSLTPRQERLVDMISRNAERQAKIVENVLDLARFQSGKLKIDFRPFDVAPVVAQVVEEWRLAGATTELQVDVDEALPRVSGDPDLIAQVLRNLLDNALRYAKRRIVLTAERAGQDDVSISVVDDGVGIPPERLGDLFTEFVQLERPSGFAPKANGYRGTGLGLTICREIIAGHRGRITAGNAPGRGARFEFTLPARGAPEQAAPREDPRLVTFRTQRVDSAAMAPGNALSL